MLSDDFSEDFQPPAPRRYVLVLDMDGSFVIFDPGWQLKGKTSSIELASRFDSMSEAMMSAFFAGLDDFSVLPLAA